ncbi:MAG: alpha,alpha-trehalose-phosphate synthase (UDP-forming) [Xanthobacteraceae bacterium]
MAQLVIVSNRVPLPGNSRAGGLEVGVRAALRHKQGLWFGWSGKVAPRSKIETHTTSHRDIRYVVTDIAEEDYQEFYNGYANRVLWPILHYRLDLAEFSRRDLSGYMRVNEHFANELHKLLQPDDIIWVHDYHFLPLASALRALGHKNRIGFFLHIPCPPPEILTALPNHERLLRKLCDYDLIGFQTGDDAANFSRYLTRELGLHSRDFRFSVGDRRVQVDAFPIGVETATLARLAQRAASSRFVQKVVGSLDGRALIIGVDRLDYSKGITQRMEAFERFLIDNPTWRGRVTYLQITPKSRVSIPEYAEMAKQVSATTGHINGTYGEADWTPIRYVNRTYTRSTLAGLFRGARAGLVTPLRDGMNLVAKEYVSAQNPEDPGVLILSRFAGAARELTAALLVNPYDQDSVSSAILRALTMPIEERRDRHITNYRILAANDVEHWANRFLDELTRPAPVQQEFEPVSGSLPYSPLLAGSPGMSV